MNVVIITFIFKWINIYFFQLIKIHAMVNLLFKSLKYTRDKYHVKAKKKCFGWRLLSKRRLKKKLSRLDF